MLTPEILVYSYEWHVSQSKAFIDLVIDPLKTTANVSHKAWSDQELSVQPAFENIVFCQLLPPTTWLKSTPERIVWIPMWDNVRAYPQQWWDALPKNLRIVAFSEAVALRSRAAGLPTLRLHYFKNPADFSPAAWEGERVLLYWNRCGMISPSFLALFCQELHIDRLLFRADIDPGIDARAHYTLPNRLGNTRVETLPRTATREAYWHLIQEANVVIAPRLFEGAGMVFLEALARGCATFAHNAPTMNEYIVSGVNGYLFQRQWSFQRLRAAVETRLAHVGLLKTPPFVHSLSNHQDWQAMSNLDIEAIGRRGLQDHLSGYQAWQDTLSEFVRFVCK